MNEEKASTIILLETKGGKTKKDPIELARACDFIVDHMCNGSYKKASEYIQNRYKYYLSDRMLRKLTNLLRLPEEVQQQLLRREIGIDVAAQLSESEKLNDETKIKVGKAIAGMLAHDAREVIQYAIRFPEASIDEYKHRVLAAKSKKEQLFVAVIPIQEDDYRKLKEVSQKRNMSLHQLCSKIIEDWLKNEGEKE